MISRPRPPRQVYPDAPPFEFGDNLTPAEFVRHWDLHPEIKTAELIRGVAYIFPFTTVDHGTAHSDLCLWLVSYRIGTEGVKSGSRVSLFLGDDILQPDQHIRVWPRGHTWDVDGYLHGPPELVAEVSYSSRSHDLHVKKDIYETSGVEEYLCLLLHENEFRWHTLVDGRYQLMPPDAEGIHRSRVFPGLWLDGAALLKRDMQRVLAVVHSGLASPEHQAFVEQLAKKRGGG
jgi:hypothetical protein